MNRTTVMVAGIAAQIGLAVSTIASAQQAVDETTAPDSRWTPASAAPTGTLSHALEGQRHDFFIDLAQQGDIDLVFFGTTEAEMWWWPDRGLDVWDRAFGSLRAANFGSQGTRAESLLWRMRNGELDGYQAKLIVLQAGGAGRVTGTDEFISSYAALIDEVRARQPQAKVLLFAPLPRGGTLASWRQSAQANAAVFAELVDDETVFYTDIGERFFRDDGSFIGDALWSQAVTNPGTQAGAYEIWAEELRPWIDRFVL